MRTKVSVTNEDFLKSFLATQANGGTFEDLSVELKLEPLSLYQRWTKLNKQLKAEGVSLPKMSLKAKKSMNISGLKAIVVAHGVVVKSKAENSHEEMLEAAKTEQTYVEA